MAEEAVAVQRPWKVLIVDDEPEIHILTTTVLKDVRFDDRPLQFLSAYTEDETRRIMRAEPDIALVLMDIIMEREDTGLELIRYIREELGNRITRIILRTGGPLTVPERRIIVDYEINDYKVKIDLTSPRLFTSVIKSLRNYRDLTHFQLVNRELEHSREQLSRVINASSGLFGTRSVRDFTAELKVQVESLLSRRGNVEFVNPLQPGKNLPGDVRNWMDGLSPTGFTGLTGDHFIGRLESGDGRRLFVVCPGCADIPGDEMQMMEVFFSNMNIVFNNLKLKDEAQATLSEMISLIGDVVENRTLKSGRELMEHQNRVSEYAVLLARKWGLSEDEITIFADAVKLHDTGKIGISDSILYKPGRLTHEEFEIMKTHTSIGYDILKFSSRKIFQMAATIAREHHERWDGTGYPRGLAGEDIDPLGRITCIVDVFDALCSRRVYREEVWDIDQTLKYIREGRGSQFDPMMVDLFLEERERIRQAGSA